MSDVICQGYHAARDAGLLEDDATIVLALALTGIVVDADDINVSDCNIATNEYDGAGYQRHTAAGVTWQYDATDDEMQLDCDDDPAAFNVDPDDPVVAATTPPVGIVFILQVGGSPDPDVDYLLGYNDSGAYGNGNGGTLGLTVPVGGFLFSKQAA